MLSKQNNQIMNKCYVGFDTSNYTTSAAVCDEQGRVVANLKIPLPVKEGNRGLRQSDAVFEHVRNLPALMGALKEVLVGYDPVAVGVSATPRQAEGSYMPCFLSGKAVANAFAAAVNCPVHEFSHQDGHVMAAVYSSGEEERLLSSERFLAFHVSGGTTELLLVRPRKNDEGFDIELVGETLDINAGQAIDRVGVSMGLTFPAGPEMERLAAEYKGKLPKRSVCVREGSCSLSGVENIAAKMLSEGKDKSFVAAFVFDFVERTLAEMCAFAIEKYGDMPVLFAGGVMSNKLMRKGLGKSFDALFAEPEFSADNAAGISLLCRKRANTDKNG
jgi:N6-L-threonylcarbamoyladenine synthase